MESSFFRDHAQKIFGKQTNILLAVAESGQAKTHNIHVQKQITAKHTLPDSRVQILLGSSDDLCLHHRRFERAGNSKLFFL